MALTLQRTLKALSRLRHTVSAAFLLQSGACAVVAWSVLHGGITIPPTTPSARTATDEAAGPMGAAGPMIPTGPMGAAGPMAAAASGTGTPVRAAGASPYSSSPQLAAAPGLAEARLALSTIDVIVTRNDTLDRIFRRLKLNLADLASLRSLPRAQAVQAH